MKFKATPAQNIALHTLQSVGLSALVTLIVSLGQFVSLHGLDWQQLGTFAAGGFLTSMAMMWKTLSSNPNTMQAILDTLGEIKDLQTASPVTINNHPAAPALATPAPPVQPFTNTVTSSAPQFVTMPAPNVAQTFNQPAPFPYQPSSTYPNMPAVQP